MNLWLFCLLLQLKDWENPAVLAMNREPAHATLMPYDARANALAGIPSRSTWYASLNGPWKFQLTGSENAPANFQEVTADVANWDDIEVPVAWDVKPDQNLGSLRRNFQLPQHWRGRRVMLHFGSIGSAAHVWVNGQQAGYTQGSGTPAEFDITHLVKPGKNVLAVRVYGQSDGSLLEATEQSGICGDVYLFAQAETHIRDLEVRTDLDEAYRDGTLAMNIHLRNRGEGVALAHNIDVELLDHEGNQVLTETTHLMADVPPGEEVVLHLEQAIANPLKWSAEAPNLYTLVLSHWDGNGSLREIITTRVGFRKLEQRDGQLLVNGVPVTLRGVNFQRGRMVTEASMLKAIEQMKRFNINAVRLAHSPGSPRFYELCDQYGLYVVNEANITTADETLASNQDWQEAYQDRMQRMLERDKNHPSILIWSVGKPGSGTNAEFLREWTTTRDPSRPLQDQEAIFPWNWQELMTDERLHPSIWEMKQTYSPIQLVASDKGFTLTNRHDFTDLKPFEGRWRIEADGEPIHSGSITLPDLAPHGETVIQPELPEFERRPGVAYLLTMSIVTRFEQALVPKGHEITWGQLELPGQPFQLQDKRRIPPLTLDAVHDRLQVRGDQGFALDFSTATGDLLELKWRGKSYLDQGPQRQSERGNLEEIKHRWLADGLIQLTVRWQFAETGRMITTYRIAGTGQVAITNRLEASPLPPRVGQVLKLPARFNQMTWFGRGPHASYQNRNTGAKISRYTSPVADLNSSQDGYRSDIRWASLHDGAGSGLLTVAVPSMALKVSPGAATMLHVAHEGERLSPETVQYTYILRPYTSDDDPPAELARGLAYDVVTAMLLGSRALESLVE